MESFMDLFQIIILMLGLAAVVFLFVKKVSIGYIILATCFFVAIGSKMSIGMTLTSIYTGAVSYNSVGFALILTLIMMIENIMRKTGMISRMVEGIKSVIKSRKAAAMIMPAIIGLLPSPGGARFSMPLVQEAVGDQMSTDRKVFINYWFRHVWMDSFMLYPGVILASSLMGINVLFMFVLMMPFMLLYILTGIIADKILSKGEKLADHLSARFTWKAFLGILANGSLILIVIALYMILTAFKVPYSLPFATGITVVFAFIIKRYSGKAMWQTLKESVKPDLIALTVGVMVLNQLLLDAKFFESFSGFLTRYGIPNEILFVVLPFVGAYSTGITLSYVALAFPLLIGLGLNANIWYGVAAFLAGYAALMATPIHLCGPMTCDYYGQPVNNLTKNATLASIPILLMSIGLIFLVKLF
jgi:integral membrane protein (TIGR00529 family)